MKSFRYSLNQILKSKGHEYDIMNTHLLSFKRSQKAFQDNQKELKSLWKKEIKSASETTEEDQLQVVCLPFCLVVVTQYWLFLQPTVPCQLHIKLRKLEREDKNYQWQTK